jgi:hypothetical protein
MFLFLPTLLLSGLEIFVDRIAFKAMRVVFMPGIQWRAQFNSLGKCWRCDRL